MGRTQVAFDFMRISVPAPSIPAIRVEEGNTSDQVNINDSKNGGAAGRSVGQRSNGETRGETGRGRRGRGRRGRGHHGGDNGQRRNNGKAWMRSQT